MPKGYYGVLRDYYFSTRPKPTETELLEREATVIDFDKMVRKRNRPLTKSDWDSETRKGPLV